MIEYHYGNHREQILIDGEKISALRRDLALSQRELAALAGVSPATMGRIEQGGEYGTSVHGKTWRAIAKALGLKGVHQMESIRIFPGYTFEGVVDGEYVRDPDRLADQYDRFKQQDS